MDAEAAKLEDAVNRLVDEYRSRCLWSLRADYYPQGLEDQLRTLATIRRLGDVEAFRRASELTQWLLQHSKALSVAR